MFRPFGRTELNNFRGHAFRKVFSGSRRYSYTSLSTAAVQSIAKQQKVTHIEEVRASAPVCISHRPHICKPGTEGKLIGVNPLIRLCYPSAGFYALVRKIISIKMFNTNDMHIVRNCQMYFNFDMPSTLWVKRVRTFNVKFSASNNMFCKATESNHAHLM